MSAISEKKKSFRKEGQIKTFLDKQRLKKFNTTRPALEEITKGLLQYESKDAFLKQYKSIRKYKVHWQREMYKQSRILQYFKSGV